MLSHSQWADSWMVQCSQTPCFGFARKVVTSHRSVVSALWFPARAQLVIGASGPRITVANHRHSTLILFLRSWNASTMNASVFPCLSLVRGPCFSIGNSWGLIPERGGGGAMQRFLLDWRKDLFSTNPIPPSIWQHGDSHRTE